jgi:uncharacterized damage-inducible protein DinB
MLDAWLDYHRETLLQKCDGLSDEQLRTRSVPPSPMSLLGLVRHMSEVERNWFERVIGGEKAPPFYCSREHPDADFDDVDTADVAEAFETFRSSCARAREIAAGHDLDSPGKAQRRGADVGLRWVMVHMIEEYARHNGHADLLRERIDGQTGE